MAEIALRAYIKTIDELIERENLDEAIAHARHILQVYPKHLETYRLLGKAYLEARRYGDSADIFQRVLSAVPDDFIAHIGMSIVREDEGNLDAAIWHMERAFETNPANPAIQQELRRLIGKRDGLEPHKVRLTRGALARMYAQGELFPQAIAELRSALQEESDRPDLQVLLADMYWRTDQKVEAAEVADRILKKLPYCWQANQMMAAVLQANGKIEEAAIYHRRLAALDPYAAFVESAIISPATVDANSVRLERLEWHPGMALPGGEAVQPAWAASLGVDLETPPEPEAASGIGPAPSWLEALQEGSTEGAPPAEAEETIEPLAGEALGGPEAEIPQWMQEAGWTPASGEAAEGPVSFSESELKSLESGIVPGIEGSGEPEGLTPANIPSWLQGKAPAAPPAAAPPRGAGAEEARPAEGFPDWLSEVAADAREVSPDPQMAAASQAEPGETPPEEMESPELPTWLETATPGATSTIVTWLGDRDREAEVGAPATPSWMAEEAEPEAEVQATEGGPSEELPSWINEFDLEGAEAEGEAAAGEEAGAAPSWLSAVAEAAATEEADFGPELTQAPDEFPEGGDELFAAPEETAEIESPIPAAEIPDWIQALSEGGEDEEAAWLGGLEATPAPADEGLAPPAPEWLAGILDEEGQPVAGPEEAEAPTPDWLSGLAEEPAPPAPTPAAPDWLSGLEEEPAQPAAAPPAPDWLSEVAGMQGEEAEGAPDWLSGMAETARSSGDETPSETFRWLRSLDEGKVEPAEPAAAAPTSPEEWMRAVPEAGEEIPEPAGPAAAEEIVGKGEADWLESLAEAEEIRPEPEEAAPVIPEMMPSESLDWLGQAEEGAPGLIPAEEAVGAAPEMGLPESLDDDEVFSWLEDLATRDATAAAGSAAAEAAPPTAPQPAFSDHEPPEAPDESLDWLERLATERGLRTEVSLAENQASIPSQPPGPPEGQLAEEPAPAIPQPEPEFPAFGAEPPDWLRSVAAGEIGGPEPEQPPAGLEFLFESKPAEEEAVPPEPVAAETGPLDRGPIDWPQYDATPPGKPPSGEATPPPAAAPPSMMPPWKSRPETAAPEAAEAKPAWSAPVEPISKPPAPSAAAPATAEMPEWLRQPAEAAAPPPAQAPEPEAKPQPTPPAETAIEPSEAKAPPAIPEPAMAAPEPQPAALVIPAKPAKAAQPSAADLLEMARQAVAAGDSKAASAVYGKLVKKRQQLNVVISDLEAVLQKDPQSPALWQALGDAYMKGDHVTEAINAYRRGMEVA
jgi:tetratricopeptide (TPR) repeat protein